MPLVPPYSPHQPQPEAWARDLIEAQNRVQRTLHPIQSKPWIAGGELLQEVELTTGFNNINHRLGRALRGWWLVRQQQSAVRLTAYRATTQAIDHDTVTVVAFSSVSGAGTSALSTSTGLFTVPHGGYYRASFRARLVDLADAKVFTTQLVVNGTRRAYASFGYGGAAGDALCAGFSDSIRLYEGDVVDVRVYHDHGSSRNLFAGVGDTAIEITSLEALQDDQASADDVTRTLRLLSDRDRTVDLVVF